MGGQGEATHWSGASVVNGTIVALLVVIMLAALFAAAECRRGVDRTAVVAGPGPGRVVAAKAVVAGSLTFAAGAVAAAIAEVVTRHIFAANGNYLFPQSGLTTTRVVIGTGLFLGLSAMLLVALGAMLRSGAAAVVAGLALLVLPGVAATIRPGTEHWLMRLTPTAAFAIQATLHRYSQVDGAFTIANGFFPISPFGGLAVLAAYTSVALSAAVWLARRHEKPRDRASA